MCKFQYESRGCRTFSDYVPGYAQGSYFPGDEPGMMCKLSLESCYIEDCDSNPAYCPVQKDTDCVCPDCGEAMKKNGDDVLWCECGHQE